MTDRIATAVIVEDGVVTNRILVPVNEEGQIDFKVEGAVVLAISPDNPATVGWTYDDGRFHEPVQE